MINSTENSGKQKFYSFNYVFLPGEIYTSKSSLLLAENVVGVPNSTVGAFVGIHKKVLYHVASFAYPTYVFDRDIGKMSTPL